MRVTVILVFLAMLSIAPQSRAQPLGKGIRCVAFSPDGKTVAATFGEPEQRGRVVLWNVESKKRLWTHFENQGVPSVAFAPDGKTLAIGGYDKIARLLDTAQGRTIKTFAGHANFVRAVAIAPDNKTLATASWDATVKTWDLASGDILQTLQLPQKLVYNLCYSPGGKWLMASDPNLYIWEAATGKERKRREFKFVGQWAVFAGEDTIIAGGDTGSIGAWNIDSGSERVLGKVHGRLAYSPKARKLAVVYTYTSPVGLYDYPLPAPSAQEQQRIDQLLVKFDDDSYETREAATKEMQSLGLRAEPDLRRAMKDSPSVEVRIRSRRLRQVLLEKPAAILPGTPYDLESAAFSPDGKLLACGGPDGALRIWRVRDLKEIARLSAPGKPTAR